MAESRPGRARIPELSSIPWNGPRSISDYSKASRSLSRDMAEEFSLASDELYAVLIRSFTGNPLLAVLGAPDVRLKARRTVKRLKRAAELQRAVGIEVVKFNAQFRKEFMDELPSVRDKKPVFDWKDD